MGVGSDLRLDCFSLVDQRVHAGRVAARVRGQVMQQRQVLPHDVEDGVVRGLVELSLELLVKLCADEGMIDQSEEGLETRALLLKESAVPAHCRRSS